MSKLLKSKFLLGVMVVAVMVAGVALLVAPSDVEAAYVHTGLLKMGMTSSQVMSLQQTLNANGFLVASVGAGSPGMETMYFGQLTKNAVMSFQQAKGLSMVDGIVGHQTGTSLAALSGGSVSLPPGCTSSSGFSTVTGQPCTSTASYPAGCTSSVGYSTTTGVSCATGTGSSLPAGCTSTVGYSTTTGEKCDGSGSGPSNNGGPLAGGAGSINDADFVSGLTGEEVGEGADDVEVAGLDIEADDGSDINITAVRLDFSQGTATEDFEDYASEVSLWFDGEEVARVDADIFEDDNNYDRTISLDGDAIIRAGKIGELIVAVSGVSNLDTGDVGETWTVEFESVRFEDASGAIMTESATGDINGVTRTFSFESFATSADSEFVIALQTGSDADAINKAHLIDAHATDGTDNVKLLAFTLEAEGDSDLEIREFLVDLVVTGATDVDDMVQGGASPAVRLIIDGEEYGTASYVLGTAVVGADEEVFFDDVDYTLEAGDKVDAYIEVDLNDTTGAAVSDDMDEGDTILAQITATQHAALTDIDVRDETGTQLALTDVSGTAVGEASRVYDVIFTLETDGWTNTAVIPGGAAGIDDQVTFTLEFDVTAVDGDVYVDDACTEDADGTMVEGTNAPLGFNFFQSAGTAANVALTCSFTTTSGATAATSSWKVDEGTTESFLVSIHSVANTTASSFVQLTWEGLGWSEANEAGDRLFEGSLDDTYKSNSVFLTMNP